MLLGSAVWPASPAAAAPQREEGQADRLAALAEAYRASFALDGSTCDSEAEKARKYTARKRFDSLAAAVVADMGREQVARVLSPIISSLASFVSPGCASPEVREARLSAFERAVDRLGAPSR
jgi:hypothetical protein